jgi:hypothetical protein
LRHTGQCRIAAALAARGPLKPNLSESEAADIVYGAISPDVYRIFTVDGGWTPDLYERWLTWVLGSLIGDGPGRLPAPRP